MQKQGRHALWELKRKKKIDRRGNEVESSWLDVGRLIGKNPGIAWNYAKGKKRIPPEVLAILKIFPKPRKKPVNWYKRFEAAKRVLENFGYHEILPEIWSNH